MHNFIYAARITGSMKKAIDETERRREKQHQYNLDNNITPKGVKSKISDVLHNGTVSSNDTLLNVAEKSTDYKVLSIKDIDERIKQLESEMLTHAQNLEFEQAANLRDEVSKLREQQLSR